MFKLNLPDFNLTIRKEDGKVWIFDMIRKKYIVLTPEEWVRQHFIHYLIHERKYPKSLFRIEGSLTYNKLQKRHHSLKEDVLALAENLAENPELGKPLGHNLYKIRLVHHLS